MIRHKGSRFRLYTADGSRSLGPWTTQEKAEEQERAIKASQHRKKEKPVPRVLERWARRHARAATRAVGKAADHAGLTPVQVPATRLPTKIYIKGVPVHLGSKWARRRADSSRQQTGKAVGNAEVVATIQREAKAAGATLAHDGKGGLDPRLALTVFRHDSFACSVPNCKTAQDHLDLDHIGGHVHELEEDPKAAAWLKAEAEKGKQNTAEGLHVLCMRHHNLVHQRDRAIEHGKKPPPMAK